MRHNYYSDWTIAKRLFLDPILKCVLLDVALEDEAIV